MAARQPPPLTSSLSMSSSPTPLLPTTSTIRTAPNPRPLPPPLYGHRHSLSNILPPLRRHHPSRHQNQQHLVDDNFNVKVADFGLSRLFPPNATHVTTPPKGTPGYLDPEYHRFYQLTDKSDVYSFRVVLMELISSRPTVDVERRSNEISLAMVAVSKIQKGELGQLVDPVLRFYLDQKVNRVVTQIAELAFKCLQTDRDETFNGGGTGGVKRDREWSAMK